MLFELPDSAQHRQQHRRTLDGRLCAAAFVFDRQTHVGCSDGTNPAGEHGREWCYVDAQVAHASSLGVQCVCVCVCAQCVPLLQCMQLLDGGRGEPAWGYCGHPFHASFWGAACLHGCISIGVTELKARACVCSVW
jgi:hypothetical protein